MREVPQPALKRRYESSTSRCGLSERSESKARLTSTRSTGRILLRPSSGGPGRNQPLETFAKAERRVYNSLLGETIFGIRSGR